MSLELERNGDPSFDFLYRTNFLNHTAFPMGLIHHQKVANGNLAVAELKETTGIFLS
jgi:hypothetical protein